MLRSSSIEVGLELRVAHFHDAGVGSVVDHTCSVAGAHWSMSSNKRDVHRLIVDDQDFHRAEAEKFGDPGWKDSPAGLARFKRRWVG